MLKLGNIKLSIDYSMDDLKKIISKKLKINISHIKNITVIKKSIDARDKNKIYYVVTAKIDVDNYKKYLDIKDVSIYNEVTYTIKKVCSQKRPIVVGCGPAGLFCALILSEAGLNPIIIEKGKDILSRKDDVLKFINSGVLDVSSNIQFGEGGAGTFSDAKLTTGIKDIRINKVLDEFVLASAPSDIKINQKPHIGTDNLINVLINIRKKIISLGGEFRFNSEFIGFDKNIVHIKNINDYFLETDHLVLALGHSARDTFKMLFDMGVCISQKPFAVGFRIEHLQKHINKSQYGKFADKLPPADYKLNVHTSNKRGVYTFCMCPGGLVVPATSIKDHIVTNGMSYYKRDRVNANAAILVGVTEKDFGNSHPLAGIYFQEKLEKHTFLLGGANYHAPVQLVADFINNKTSTSLGDVYPSYKPGFVLSDLNPILTDELNFALKEGITKMDNQLFGFAKGDSILTAIESRTSSPIRLLRDDNYELNIKGIYACGEGSGYAGGIMSSAVDGIKCAEKIISKIGGYM